MLGFPCSQRVVVAVTLAALLASCKTDSMCRVSDGCALYGLCTGAFIKCIVGSDADCRSSALCGGEGLCTMVDGRCRATEDEDCRMSRLCSEQRKCTAVGVSCER